MPSNNTPPSSPLFFEDVVDTNDTNLNDEEHLSLAFFELANVSRVGYRVMSSDDVQQQRRSCTTSSTTTRKRCIIVEQDPSAYNQHTGGIVWETSYLLLTYLLHHNNNNNNQAETLGRTLEVGAGCGLLGQVLGVSGIAERPVILTEAKEAMTNLEKNIQANLEEEDSSNRPHAIVRQLDWRHAARDAKLFPTTNSKKPTFDTIVGTDVVFAPTLVEPLLSTLQLMSHRDTVVYLCLQVRCADSYQRLWDKADSYGWVVRDGTDQLALVPSCAWGLQMECRLLQLTRVQKQDTSR